MGETQQLYAFISKKQEIENSQKRNEKFGAHKVRTAGRETSCDVNEIIVNISTSSLKALKSS